MKASYFPRAGVLAVGPRPVANLRHVFPVLADIARMLDQGVAELLFDVSRRDAQSGDAIDDLDRQMKPVELVEYGHVEGRCRGAFFRETADVHPGMVGAVIGQAVDQIGTVSYTHLRAH